MYLEIITPTQQIFKGNILSLKIPGAEGYLEILNNHAPLLCFIGKGKLRVTDTEKKNGYFTIEGGLLECIDNNAVLLTECILSEKNKH